MGGARFAWPRHSHRRAFRRGERRGFFVARRAKCAAWRCFAPARAGAWHHARFGFEGEGFLGRMKSAPYWRIAQRTIRRVLFRDGFVIAAAGMHPPWPLLLKGGKLGATFAAGNLRSSICRFSTGHGCRLETDEFLFLLATGSQFLLIVLDRRSVCAGRWACTNRGDQTQQPETRGANWWMPSCVQAMAGIHSHSVRLKPDLRNRAWFNCNTPRQSRGKRERQ